MDGVKDYDGLLATIRERRQEAWDAERLHAERAQLDLEFLIGEGAWPEEERRIREAEGKPCITINAAPQFVRQVTGQLRASNPAIRVLPADGRASTEGADVYSGLIRHIEYKSDATSVYEAAAESAAQCGIGHWRVRTEYCDDVSFDQDILIERIANPFSVLYDPMAKDPTRKDGQFAFIIEEMPRKAFVEAYPDASTADIASDHRLPNIDQWQTPDTVAIAEYYWVEHDEYEIGITPMGQVIQGPFPKGVEIARKRKVRAPKVMWCKTNGTDILEEPKQVPGRHIPVVAVTGEEIHMGEQTYRSSVIRFARDPLMLYNVTVSSMVEMAMLQPRAPYMVTTKQVLGLEDIWADANRANRPYLPYNADTAATAPMRVPPPIPSQALVVQAQMAIEDLKRTTGIYDASLGNRSNETSGVAIRQRQQEAQLGTSVYADNMVKAVLHTGKIIVGMIPKVYDSQRTIRILGEDGQEKMMEINQVMMQAGQIIRMNDMTAGTYDVRVAVGPSYATKKQEAAEGQMEFLRVVPQAAAVTADIIAKNQDWPEADRIAERLRKAMPPGIAEEDDDQDPAAMQAAQQAQAQQMQQMQLQQQAQEMELRKQMAETKEAEADALKAEAEAQKAVFEVQAMQAQQNAAAMAARAGLIPANPVQGTY